MKECNCCAKEFKPKMDKHTLCHECHRIETRALDEIETSTHEALVEKYGMTMVNHLQSTMTVFPMEII